MLCRFQYNVIQLHLLTVAVPWNYSFLQLQLPILTVTVLYSYSSLQLQLMHSQLPVLAASYSYSSLQSQLPYCPLQLLLPTVTPHCSLQSQLLDLQCRQRQNELLSFLRREEDGGSY